MFTAMYLAILMAALVAVFFVLRAVMGAYLEFRGKRVVTCPETKAPAAVEVDATQAAFTAVLGEPELRLKDCSRWPERQNCGQECLKQIEAAPAACLVRTMLTQWYEGKTCVYCGQPFGEINWSDHKPALMNPERLTIEWHETRPEKIPAVLATHLPVCWNCHVTESFRREHPELVLERPRRPGVQTERK